MENTYMFYKIFRKKYLSIKRDIEAINKERIEKEILPTGITKATYSYSNDGDELHQFNLYKMADVQETKHFPLIIDIHGGGWICGDKDTNNNFNYHLALGGYNVSSLSYRTIDHCTIKEQIKDIFDYLHFIKDNSDKLDINFNDVTLMGDSAGGQLALLVYCINQSEKLQKIFSVKHVDIIAKCLVLNHSVCYIDMAGNLPNNPILSKFIAIPELQRMIYGKKYINDELYLNSFNPIQYIRKETTVPPILLITSQGDTLYNYQTLKLYDFLKEEGRACELYFEKSPQAEHVFNIAYPSSEEGKKCNDFILKYISMF